MNKIFWVVFAISAIFLVKKRKWFYKHLKKETSIYILAAAVIAAAVTAFWGKWHFENSTELQSLFFALRTIFNLLEGDSEEFRNVFYFSIIWRGWTYFLSVLIPVLTASTVAILIAQHLPQFAIRAHCYYIFSHLDHRSLLMAEDIAKNTTQSAFFFLRTQPDTVDEDMLVRLQNIPYQCFPYTESTLLQYHKCIRRKYLRFFFLSEDTDENFQQMKELLEEAKAKKLFSNSKKTKDCPKEAEKSIYRQELYLLSDTISAPMLIDDLRNILCAEGGKREKQFLWTELRLLDRYRSLSYELLRQIPLYKTAVNGQNHVLILGFGKVGTAIFRTMVSFSAMVGHNIEFTLCDRRINQRYSAMLQMYPECAKGYSVYKRSLDVENCGPDDLLRDSPYTLIVVCLGDDEQDIKLATQLKRYYRKRHWENVEEIQPFICLNVENQIKSSYTKGLFNDAGCAHWDHELHPFGTEQEQFSMKMLMPRTVWTEAQKLHKLLKKEQVWDLPYWPEYERRSSIACVCHAPYHVASVSRSCDPKDSQYNLRKEEKLDSLIVAEHRRWMDYVRSEGMQNVELKTVFNYYGDLNKYVDIAGQLTPCLVPSDQLEELCNRLKKNGMMAPDSLTFCQKDQLVVDHASDFSEKEYVQGNENNSNR